MILLTALYADADSRRRDEFATCLRRNFANDRIEEVHVLAQQRPGARTILDAYPLLADEAKVRVTSQEGRATYKDLFDYANRNLSGRRVIVANADIFFDHTLARLDGYPLANKLLCLTRWDVHSDGSVYFFDHPASQDAWIFETPLRDVCGDFPLGVPGCDNRLAWEAQRAGLEVSNPGRSVRANHLHLSGIRRYTEAHRLRGQTSPLPPGFLDAPWLWFVVPCMGRLDDVRRNLPSLLQQKHSSCVLVDYSCPERCGQWARNEFGQVWVVTVEGRLRFRGAEARNKGAAAVDDDGLICFLDADMNVADRFSEYVIENLRDGCFATVDRREPGFESVLVCRKSDFQGALGFDEAFLDWGEECSDLKDKLHRNGLTEQVIPVSLLSRNGNHHDVCRISSMVPDTQIRHAIHSAYRRAKSAIIEEAGGMAVSATTLGDIYDAIMREHLGREGLSPDLGCAAVAFSESMGYAVSRLDVGVSSHTNDARPFKEVPDPLRGFQFTQVVASAVSPIEIEFLSPGKLFVLAGTDWDGYRVATSWLRGAGYKERLPIVKTTRGTAFEVWSIVGDCGERFVLPTQVMLVAERLVPRRRAVV